MKGVDNYYNPMILFPVLLKLEIIFAKSNISIFFSVMLRFPLCHVDDYVLSSVVKRCSGAHLDAWTS